MVETFNVYPKEGAEKVQLDLEGFELKDGIFTLYRAGHAIDTWQYISYENVAAILPEPTPSYDGSHSFLIYLKDRKKPERVYAAIFKTDTPPTVRFYWGERDEKPIGNIYIALSEVVAIRPFKEAVAS
ncbi:MAG TPA: hypothetical protein VK582_00810 [Pyrinomonadaceae bacterium]|nr:hypothetical protein [Pyrinomonadaceae bacterium]